MPVARSSPWAQTAIEARASGAIAKVLGVFCDPRAVVARDLAGLVQACVPHLAQARALHRPGRVACTMPEAEVLGWPRSRTDVLALLAGEPRRADAGAISQGENTTEMELTNLIQNRLDTILQEQILPGKKVHISHRWSGIMGVGNQKSPIVKKISENQYCAVRLGGMGVALGSQVGVDLAELIIENS